MSKIMIFAGTIEGRRLAEFLSGQGAKIHVCVATEYGEKLLPKGTGISITSKRLDALEIKELMLEKQVSVVIDATHPYAVQISDNIRLACKEADKEYIRLLRGSSKEEAGSCIYMDNIEAAASYLKGTEGNVLITTGSKELTKFTVVADYQQRLYARVLSTPEVVAECAKLGFEGKNLICMQGPFREELNYAILQQIDAKYLVTKESGSAGGFAEKINAANRAGVITIVIGRPRQEEGFSYEEVLIKLKDKFQIVVKPLITLVGVGMGAYETMTLEVANACKNADVLIGAQRILDTLQNCNKPTFVSFQTEEILRFIIEHAEYQNVVIALSGDTGFYSGATRLITALKEYEVKVLPGISSVVSLCSKLQMTWQDVKFISTHGRNENIIAAVTNNTKVFSLLGGQDGVSELCQKLMDYGLGELKLYLGERLSYENEKITIGTPTELIKMTFLEPCAVLIENKAVKQSVITHGLKDKEFVRGKVPMTKEEIRCISISKMRLTKSSTIYDIGAGTGSVSIEMALQAVEGSVYAIEKNSEAIHLIEENKKRFRADNLYVVEGTAPGVLEDLPMPSHAFIGGSSGNLKEIITLLLKKNPDIRIVMNAITLETITEAVTCLKDVELIDIEVLQVSVSKSQEVGVYHMMMGQNPVYIISGTGGK